MKAMMLGLLAETPLHPGAGQNAGVVDLPIAREAKTGYPVIYGSAMKGALRDWWREQEQEQEEYIFGNPNNVGGVTVTDARLLLLPLRCLNGHFKLVTCPYLLTRFKRDLKLAGLFQTDFDIPAPEKNNAIVTEQIEGMLYLEEFHFTPHLQEVEGLLTALSSLIYHDELIADLNSHLVILNNDDFSYFAAHGLPIVARNNLEQETKKSKNLWYEEHLPTDTLLYNMIAARKNREDALTLIEDSINERPYLQVGGNETVGQGWCIIKKMEPRGMD